LVELLRDGKGTLSDLIDVTERRRKELDQPKPPAFFLYVDQGEELYARAEESPRFSELLAQALPDPRLRVMISLRSDFLGHLQSDQPLFNARQQIDVPPLREAELREVVSRPAQLFGARFETEWLEDMISRRTAEDSVKDVGALPLLSYTLDDMWRQMVVRGDGGLRLAGQTFELGGVLAERANGFLGAYPGAEDALRRIFTLRLATVRADGGGEPTRRRAARDEFSDEEWRLVSELADYPNWILVIVTTDAGETCAEVAHEAVFRRWDRLRKWIAAEREFLAWRNGLEAARCVWQATPDKWRNEALLMGLALSQARAWLARRSEDIPEADRKFIDTSIRQSQGAIVGLWRTIFGSPTSILRPAPQPLGSKVFISYRRADTRHIAGRVYDRLASEISDDEIFFDVDTVPIGVNFKEYIYYKVKESAVMLVIIGENWLIYWRSLLGLKPKEDFVRAAARGVRNDWTAWAPDRQHWD
jgi:hypothetical protein